MQSMAVNGYAAADVLYALRAVHGRRSWAFRYELFSAANVKVADLKNVAAGHVENDALAEIKRTAKFTVEEDGSINYASQRIKPWARLRMPDGGYAEWPLGVFLLTTPTREIDTAAVNTREIDAYDQTIVLQDDVVTNRYYVASNYLYTDAINELLTGTTGITSWVIPSSTLRTPVALDWDPGTSKFKIIDQLLTAINYTSLWFDGNGVGRAAPYVSPTSAPSAYTYATDQVSLIMPEAKQTLDFYGIPNRIVNIVSNTDRPPLTSIVVNSSPSSPTSTVNRGRTITQVLTGSDAPNQAALDAQTQTLMDTTNQVFEVIDFDTGLMPVHENAEVYTFNYGSMYVNGKFSETKWSMDLEQGAKMGHVARRVVVLA